MQPPDPHRPPRVAMLARVVFPLHGFGGIERHVFHLVTHLARLGAQVTLYVQPPNADRRPQTADRRPQTADRSPAYISELGGRQSAVGGREHSELSAVSGREHSELSAVSGSSSIVYLRYDYTSPFLRPNSIVGRQINYPWYSWQLGLKAAAAVRAGQHDVVHAQGLCAFGYGAIRRRDPLLRRVPFVANPHGLEEFRTPDWRKWLAYAPFRALYAYGTRRADRAIATDACTRGDLPHYLHVPPERVTVIPSAIDVAECLAWVRPELRAALRQRFGLDGAGPVLLSVSRLERNKGYHVLIEALARIRSELPANWRWLLVGQGKEGAALRRQAEAAGIAAHTIFVGRLDDEELHSLYEEIDLFVHPTLYEGSSLVTLEAMLHRRPVVASDAGGIPDKVFDDVNGYLVRPGDAGDLAAKLLKALAQRDRWPQWGEASEAIVRREFDWPVVARRTLALYEELRSRAANLASPR